MITSYPPAAVNIDDLEPKVVNHALVFTAAEGKR